MSASQAAALRTAVQARKNILVAGGSSSGKTTLTNAILAEVAKSPDGVVLIEDTRELQCTARKLSGEARITLEIDFPYSNRSCGGSVGFCSRISRSACSQKSISEPSVSPLCSQSS
jgi:ABC-type glutathione transport system ATPase component